MAIHVVAGVLAVLASFSSPQDPPKPAAAAAKEEELKYPTFEPFVASRMFKFIAPDLDQVDLAKLAKDLGEMAEINKQSKEAGERAGGIEKQPDRPSAHLLPRLPEDERPIYALVPIVMMKLAPLWDAKSWSESQVALASQAAQILSRVKSAPAFAFKKGDDANNRKELEKLVRWFHATAAKPECLAAMIFTMDDGPYAGLPHVTDKVLDSSATQALDEHTQLRLAKVEREGEAWVMQCVRDGKLAWSRVISAAPDGAVKDVSFASDKPMPLGTYGSKVFLRVDWTYGSEQGWMNLDPKGNLLFYFLSW